MTFDVFKFQRKFVNMMNQVPHVQVPQVPQVPAVLIGKLQEYVLMDSDPRWTLVEWNDGAKLVIKFRRNNKSADKPKRKRRRRKPKRQRKTKPRPEVVEKSTETSADLPVVSEVMQTDFTEECSSSGVSGVDLSTSDPACETDVVHEVLGSPPLDELPQQSDEQIMETEECPPSDDLATSDSASETVVVEEGYGSPILDEPRQRTLAEILETDPASLIQDSGFVPIDRGTHFVMLRKYLMVNKNCTEEQVYESLKNYDRPRADMREPEDSIIVVPRHVLCRYVSEDIRKHYKLDKDLMRSDCKDLYTKLTSFVELLKRYGSIGSFKSTKDIVKVFLDGLRIHQNYKVLVVGSISKYDSIRDTMSFCADCCESSDQCKYTKHSCLEVNKYKCSRLYNLLQKLFLFKFNGIWIQRYALCDK